MFENFSNVIFIAVALAIFVGRTVAQARKKRQEEEEKAKSPVPPPPPRPRVQTLHFEEKDDDYVPGYLKKPAPKPKPSAKKPQGFVSKPVPAPVKVEETPSIPVIRPAGMGHSEQGSFSFNLNHLTPLKQAVVMAEILGPPKALS